MKYNTRFKMQDLFMNPRLAKIFPQFERNESPRSLNSKAKTVDRIKRYIVGALNGVITGKHDITVKGGYKKTLERVQRLQPVLEQLFNQTTVIADSLRASTRLYTPFESVAELEGFTAFHKKLSAMNIVLENLKYNPDFQGRNNTANATAEYLKRQKAWKRKVGYKE